MQLASVSVCLAAVVYTGVLFSFYFYVEAGIAHRYDGLLTWESLLAYTAGAVPYVTILLLGAYLAFVATVEGAGNAGAH